VTAPLELVAGGLHFPTSLAFDGAGAPWVAESGLPFGGAPAGGRLVRLGPGSPRTVAGDLRSPVNGLLRHGGAFIVSEGGRPGCLSRITEGGARSVLVDGLPGFGDYQTNMCAAGPDGRLYFSQGAMTNLGVVGPDSFDLAWLREVSHDVDIPGHEVVVSEAAFESPAPAEAGEKVRTGAFAPFGSAPAGERRIPGRVPCTAAVLRCRPDGSDLELCAWGLRNAYGLLFMPDGRLLATDQGADDRGSRPAGHAPDLLYDVRPGLWYGFPDFIGGVPVSDPRFRPSRGPQPSPVLRNHEALPPLARPLVEFPVNAAATKLDRLPDGAPRHPGQLLVCLFGDERPLTGPAGPKVGRSLLRVDLRDGSLHPVPAGPFHRPIDVRVRGDYVYVVDFGEFEMAPGRVEARPGSGAVYRFPMSAL